MDRKLKDCRGDASILPSLTEAMTSKEVSRKKEVRKWRGHGIGSGETVPALECPRPSDLRIVQYCRKSRSLGENGEREKGGRKVSRGHTQAEKPC